MQRDGKHPSGFDEHTQIHSSHHPDRAPPRNGAHRHSVGDARSNGANCDRRRRQRRSAPGQRSTFSADDRAFYRHPHRCRQQSRDPAQWRGHVSGFMEGHSIGKTNDHCADVLLSAGSSGGYTREVSLRACARRRARAAPARRVRVAAAEKGMDKGIA